MLIHDFNSSNSVGNVGESILYSLLDILSPGNVKVVTAVKEWQAKGVDFVLEDIYYDVKFDTKANSTGNLAFETVSKSINGNIIKPGWVYASEADCIAYMYLNGLNWDMFFFTPPEIKKMVDSSNYQVKPIKNTTYESEVVLVPISSLGHKQKMEIPVAGTVNTQVLEFVHKTLKTYKERK